MVGRPPVLLVLVLVLLALLAVVAGVEAVAQEETMEQQKEGGGVGERVPPLMQCGGAPRLRSTFSTTGTRGPW